MIIVTGGAGFIGSCLQEALFRRGERTVVIDRLRSQGKWRNLVAHPPHQVIPPETLPAFLEQATGVKAVFHLGAVSATTSCEGDHVWATNVALSQRLWRWCAYQQVPFIYASSAATYGAANTSGAFQDGLESVEKLQPLNLYGWSKQAFDLWVKKTLEAGEPSPSQWAGLKFFNVYGPNEYHKGNMISVVKVKYDELKSGKVLRLFCSDVPGLPNGQQKRDFIWVGDTVKVMLWLLDHPEVNGLFNCGTGVARSYLDLAHAICDVSGHGCDIEFIAMPEALRGQYQSFTCADMSALRAAGYNDSFIGLEDGIAEYIGAYLLKGEHFL